MDYETTEHRGEEKVISTVHILCLKCGSTPKHSAANKCDLSCVGSFVKCVNQRDKFPLQKCVDCRKPVHIGCSYLYPKIFNRKNSDHGLQVRCLLVGWDGNAWIVVSRNR